MSRTFTTEELLAWIDKGRADAVVGPSHGVPDRPWTNEDINRAWSRSAQNVLTMLEDFITSKEF